MPDFSVCVKDHNGNIWCWDRESRAVIKIKTEQPAIDRVPPEVLLDLLKEREKNA